MKRLRAAGGVCAVLALALSGCAAGQGGAPEEDDAGGCAAPDGSTIKVGINPGSQDLIVSTITEQGFDADHGIELSVNDFQNPPAAATAVTQKAVDIGFGGNTTMTVARATGSDVVFFGPFITTPKDGVFVRKGSDIEDLGDLDGMKIGSFSGTNSATVAILSAVASEAYGIDELTSSSEIVTAPGPAALGLLDQEEVEATLLVDTHTVMADLTGKYRKILDLNEAYQEAFGTNPMFVGLVTTESYADANCGEVTAFAAAYRDAIEYIRGHDEVWQEYADSLEMTDDGAAEGLKNLGTEFQTEWNDEKIAEAEGLLESLIPILGEENYVAEIPEGLFTSEYWGGEAE